MPKDLILCDGCGQPASPEHLTRRFRRLEETTRFRPVHIQTVFLAGVSPLNESEFLYTQTEMPFEGEALALLKALDIEPERRSREGVLAEFQRRGYLLAHILECPMEGGEEGAAAKLLETRLGVAITRLKRSLKPKRVVLVSASLGPYVRQLRAQGLEAEVVSEGGFAALA